MRKFLEEDISLESNKRIVLSIKTFNLFINLFSFL